MSDRYILVNGEPVREPDLLKWAEQFESESRRIAFTKINGVDVSTVFLGLDHSFNGGVPILFETMIFGGVNDQYQERYATLEESIRGHERAVMLTRKTPRVIHWLYDVWMRRRK